MDFRAQIGGGSNVDSPNVAFVTAMLITVRPGLVLHLWQGGKEVAAVPVSPSASLGLCRDLLATLARAMPP